MAYVARYGCQPLSELRELPVTDLARLSNELSSIVKEEKKKPVGVDEGD